MATSKSINPVRRASDRDGAVIINASHEPLKSLMIEQGSQSWNYLTVYRGTRQQLADAGIPEDAFPAGRAKRREFKVRLSNVCCTGRRETINGLMRKIDEHQFELELQWGSIRPYVQASHPALTELGRMLLRGALKYVDDWDGTRLEQPFEVLALNPEATDYKPAPDSRKFRVTPEFHAALREAASNLYELVQSRGEIVLMEEAAPAVPARISDGNVVNIAARKATCAGRQQAAGHARSLDRPL
jgi:hypothetical protein